MCGLSRPSSKRRILLLPACRFTTAINCCCPHAPVYHRHQRPCSFPAVRRSRRKSPPLPPSWFVVATAALARSPSVSALNRVCLRAGRPLPSRPRPSSACYEPPSPCHGLASAESPAFDPPCLGPHLDAVSRPGHALPESRPSAWFPPSRYEMDPVEPPQPLASRRRALSCCGPCR